MCSFSQTGRCCRLSSIQETNNEMNQGNMSYPLWVEANVGPRRWKRGRPMCACMLDNATGDNSWISTLFHHFGGLIPCFTWKNKHLLCVHYACTSHPRRPNKVTNGTPASWENLSPSWKCFPTVLMLFSVLKTMHQTRKRTRNTFLMPSGT